jgi:eukaryotic-like serine/threonine-protein kinase
MEPIRPDEDLEDTQTDVGAAAPRTRVLEPPSSPSSPSSSSLGDGAFTARFRRREILGRGGMGEVGLFRDERLGRDVAVKTLLPQLAAEPTARARFLREAQVQGRLEHPAIVPVHDLRDDGDGGLTLTMMRVRGRTLAQVLTEHVDDPAPPRRLLQALARVCHAVDFAHAHGVIHRDLKPGNIMIGDYGEVYVLDWGLAKLLDEAGEEPAVGGLSPTSMTQSGSLLGTPGYMAPEQLDDSRGAVGPSSDVFSLGAILFEIVAGRPLVTAPSAWELVQRTLAGVDARARSVVPHRDVPPELEALCIAATSMEPGQRPTARAMSDALEAFLEGARDLQRRQALADEHVAIARAVLSATGPDADESASRARAMRELGAAIALCPGHVEAGRAVVRLLAEPPRVVPPAVQAELQALDDAQVAEGARLGAPLALSWLAFLPFVWFMGIVDWRPIAVFVAASALVVIITTTNAGRARLPLSRQVLAYLSFGMLCIASSVVAGPLLAVPTVIATFIAAFQAHPLRSVRRGITVGGVALLTGMVALEWMGLWPASYVFVDGTIVVRPVALGFPEAPTRLLLLTSSVAAMLAAAMFLSRLRDSLAAAQARVSLLGWHLRQLVPEDPRPPPLRQPSGAQQEGVDEVESRPAR